jgi:hypothetical protein
VTEQTDTAKPSPALTSEQRKVLRSLARRQERIVKYRNALQSEYDGRLDDLFAARKIVPPALVEDICAYSGITESAYRAILRNAKERQGENGKG